MNIFNRKLVYTACCGVLISSSLVLGSYHDDEDEIPFSEAQLFF